ncbi:MAG: hypothetical protein AAF607_16360 [Pseudomonadota bacterium]
MRALVSAHSSAPVAHQATDRQLTLAASNDDAARDALKLVPATALLQRQAAGALPKLEAPRALSEILVAEPQDGAASAFAWAMAQALSPERPLIVWVQDQMTMLETGRPYVPGLCDTVLGNDVARRFLLIATKAGQDMLWAMEEVLLSGAASAVIGEIWGLPKALNFTATKRLQRAAQIGKTPCLLTRYGREKPASGAHERWHVTSRASGPHPQNSEAPGRPAWALDLFKARTRQPSLWTVEYDKQSHHLHLAAALADGPVFKSAAS